LEQGNSTIYSFRFRKHCTACKCPRDAHDVIHQESVNVKDRLGLKESQLQTPSIMVMDIKGRPTSTDIYAWIPAGMSPDRVRELITSPTRLGSPSPPQTLFFSSL
jgi:hypothetical protein